MSSFEVAIVTGGGSGIGQEVARELVARGAKVVLNGRRENKLEETANTIDPVVVRSVAGARFTQEVDAGRHRLFADEPEELRGGRFSLIVLKDGGIPADKCGSIDVALCGDRIPPDSGPHRPLP